MISVLHRAYLLAYSTILFGFLHGRMNICHGTGVRGSTSRRLNENDKELNILHRSSISTIFDRSPTSPNIMKSSKIDRIRQDNDLFPPDDNSNKGSKGYKKIDPMIHNVQNNNASAASFKMTKAPTTPIPYFDIDGKALPQFPSSQRPMISPSLMENKAPINHPINGLLSSNGVAIPIPFESVEQPNYETFGTFSFSPSSTREDPNQYSKENCSKGANSTNGSYVDTSGDVPQESGLVYEQTLVDDVTNSSDRPDNENERNITRHVIHNESESSIHNTIDNYKADKSNNTRNGVDNSNKSQTIDGETFEHVDQSYSNTSQGLDDKNSTQGIPEESKDKRVQPQGNSTGRGDSEAHTDLMNATLEENEDSKRNSTDPDDMGESSSDPILLSEGGGITSKNASLNASLSEIIHKNDAGFTDASKGGGNELLTQCYRANQTNVVESLFKFQYLMILRPDGDPEMSVRKMEPILHRELAIRFLNCKYRFRRILYASKGTDKFAFLSISSKPVDKVSNQSCDESDLKPVDKGSFCFVVEGFFTSELYSSTSNEEVLQILGKFMKKRMSKGNFSRNDEKIQRLAFLGFPEGMLFPLPNPEVKEEKKLESAESKSYALGREGIIGACFALTAGVFVTLLILICMVKKCKADVELYQKVDQAGSNDSIDSGSETGHTVDERRKVAFINDTIAADAINKPP